MISSQKISKSLIKISTDLAVFKYKRILELVVCVSLCSLWVSLIK